MLCNERPLYKDIPNGFATKTLLCRSWNCSWCARSRKRQVIREAMDGDPLIFVTLTLHEDCAEDPYRWAGELVNAWRKFVRYYKRRHHLSTIPYFAVFEATKQGVPHLHILCRTPWIQQETLSNFMAIEVGAPIVWVKKVRHRKKAAIYLAKYMGKSPGKFGTLKRYWKTKNWCCVEERPRRKRSDGFVWWRRSEYNHFENYIMYVWARGYDCTSRDGVFYYKKPEKEKPNKKRR